MTHIYLALQGLHVMSLTSFPDVTEAPSNGLSAEKSRGLQSALKRLIFFQFIIIGKVHGE